VSTLAATYLPSFTGGTSAAIHELAPSLVGLDPCNLFLVHRAIDPVLMGLQSAQRAIDLACLDLFGNSVGLPVDTLLGGVLQADFPLYEAVPLASAKSMVDFVTMRSAACIKCFQLKVGNDPYEDAARVRSVAEAVEPDTRI